MSEPTPSKGRFVPPAKEEIPAMVLVAATIIVCCVAPLLAYSVRVPLAPPDAYPIFLRLFAFNDYAGAMAMLVAMTLALAVPQAQKLLMRAAVWVGDHPLHTAALAFVLLALCARFVYLAHPLSMDEYAPYMQAHAFARGEIAAQYDPTMLDWLIPRQHQGTFIATNHATGDAVAVYWPGLALVMMPFVWLDATWCVNPAFGALALLLIHRLVRDAAGSPAAGGIAMLAALASPQFTVNAVSYYAMAGELTLNLLFLWLLLKPGIKWALAAGLAGGLSLIMHNPVPHGLMAVPCLVWLALNRERWPRLIALLAGYLPFVAVGLGWSMVMSEAMATQQAAETSSVDGVIRGLIAFMGSVLTLPSDYLLMAKWYAAWKLWIWTAPGLLLLMFIPRRREVLERLLILGFALTFLFYFFVHYDQGHGWGYRYMHGAWAALPIVAGIWWAQTSDRMRAVGAAAMVAGLLATPVFMWQTRGTIEHELSWRLDTPAGKWVVFVAQNTGFYRGDLVQNPPGQDNLIYLASRGPEADRALMAQRFPVAVLEHQDQRGSAWRLPDDGRPVAPD